MWDITELDIYQVDKSSLRDHIRQCGIEPGTSHGSKELRKIGAFLKRFGRMVVSDEQLKQVVSRLNDGASVTLSSQETSLCPELKQYVLLLQGEFSSLLEKEEQIVLSPSGAKSKISAPLKVPNKPPPSPPTLQNVEAVGASTAVNALAQEMQRVLKLVEDLRKDCNIITQNVQSQQQQAATFSRQAEQIMLNDGIGTGTNGIHRLDTNASRSHSSYNARQPLSISGKHDQVSPFKPSFELVSILPTFSGDDDGIVSDFICQINDVGNLSHWTEHDKLTVAKLKLTGTAMSFSKSDEACQNAKTLHQLEDALEIRFREKLPEHFYFEQLACIKQERGESIEKFTDRVKQIGSKTIRRTQNQMVDQALQKENDRRIMEAFTRGLFGELGHEVRIKFPQSFRAAVTLAVTIRNVERRPSNDVKFHGNKGIFFSPANRQTSSTPHSYQHNKHPTQLPNHQSFNHKYSNPSDHHKSHSTSYQGNSYQRNHHFNNPLHSQSQNFSNPKFCNYCKRNGHTEVECRTKQRTLSGSLIQCQVCGRGGHSAQVCRFRSPFSRNSPTNRTQTQPSNSTGDLTPATGVPHSKDVTAQPHGQPNVI